MNLNRAIQNTQRHARCRHLDHGDFLAGHLVAHGIHHVGGLQGQQAALFDFKARTGNVFADRVKLRQRLAESFALIDALAHGLERALCNANGAHAVVNTPRPEAALGNFKAATFTQQHIADRHAYIVVFDFRMTVRRMVIAEYRQRTDDLHARSIQRYENHGLLLVTLRFRIRLAHNNRNFAGGGHGT